MRKSPLQLYAPFLVLALIQALLIVVAPSRGSQGQDLSALNQDLGAGGTGRGASSQGFGSDTSGDVGGLGASGTGGGTSGATGAGGGGSAAGGGGAAGDAASGAGDAASGAIEAGGDTSHCAGELQYDITRTPPPCVPSWPDGADNGGNTYQGVTANEIKIVVFDYKPNEQVDAILRAEGLATTNEEEDEAYDAYFAFANKRLETYGREIVWKRVEGDCPTTPPDYDVCTAEAQQVVKERPFAVIWNTPLYASVFDVWVNNQILSVGGWHFDESFFTQRRPFRYDPFMDGTQSADIISEYFCTKMAKQGADHAGQVIHPEIGGRTTPRHLGIVVPEIEANVVTAKRVSATVAQCNGKTPPIFTYESDIERATEQTNATVSGLIEEKVTTVVCMCDPIAPAFLTNGMTNHGYYPEFLMPGLGLLDYDKLGRLYDPQQMAHAFGPSHLAVDIPLDDTDAARVWRDMGGQGHPCADNGCQTHWANASLLVTGLQMAGPDLNPLTFEQGLLQNLPEAGGRPDAPLEAFGPGDYTRLSDAKEVYWSETERSEIDGRTRGYVAVDGGRRYRLGQWPPGLDQIPVAPN